MQTFNWLHLTDLHFGLSGQPSLWPNVKEAFLGDLTKMHGLLGSIDAVLFTGDLVQSGEVNEFNKFQERVLIPILEHLRALGSSKVVFLAVPGNHDLTRPEIKKPSAALRQLLREDGFSEIEDEFWEGGVEYKNIIDAALENYENWWDKIENPSSLSYVKGFLAGDFTATITIGSDDKDLLSIGVVGINSTFLQINSGNYQGRLALNLRQIHEACGEDLPRWVEAHDACILMTHQGPAWLNKQSQLNIETEINPAGRFSVHLFGHMHKSEMISSSLGGGGVHRTWQGNSLFGVEKFDSLVVERRHGYSVGRIIFTEGQPQLRMWPRRALVDKNGWRFVSDTEAGILEDDGGTKAEFIEKRNSLSFRKSQRDISLNGAKINLNCSLAGDGFLKIYYQAIIKAHSYIRFVEMPHLKDVSDVQIDNLYVESKFSVEEIHPDTPVRDWAPRIGIEDLLLQSRHLVILGDPGSGKSTLLSYIAWQLCRPEKEVKNIWDGELKGFVPIPMILRELSLKADLTWEGLIDAFLEHRIGKLLINKDNIQRLLTQGRAFILLDGLDEVGNLSIRQKLRDVVHEGLTAYPNSRWLLTSRVVGYDGVPFHFKLVKSAAKVSGKGATEMVKGEHVPLSMADKLFLSPFDDSQIKRFAINWHSQHEREGDMVAGTARNFISAIKENEGTQRLARIPYLITLMALIHHKNIRLPHGRTELYDRIAVAYLESIDVRRRLNELPYSLAQKKRWLAGVAYQMQLRRSANIKGGNQGEIFATREEVEVWIKIAMGDSLAEASETEIAVEASLLLDYFAKRSGLLLPRGEGKFAFMHLSLQEYFAACYLEPRLTASRFGPVDIIPDPTDAMLYGWANDEVWREAFVLLFELISEKDKNHAEAFLSHLFVDRLEGDSTASQVTAAGLLAELSTDPFVLLSLNVRTKSKQDAWRWVFRQGSSIRRNGRGLSFRNQVVRSLLRDSQGDLQKCLRSAQIPIEDMEGVEELDFTGCSNLISVAPLVSCVNLKYLNLTGCSSLLDLRPLGQLSSLKRLDLQSCGAIETLSDIVDDLGSLESLYLNQPLDLNVISKLKALSDLHLHFPFKDKVDFSPLAGMSNLNRICCPGNRADMDIFEPYKSDPDLISSPAIKEIFTGEGGRRREKRVIRRKGKRR